MNSDKVGAIIIGGHIQGLSNARSLGEKGIPVYIIDENNCIAKYSKYCSKFFICPKFDSKEFINFLLKLAEGERLYGWIIIPSNDIVINNISENIELIKKYFKTLIPPPEKLQNIYDKKKLLEIAKSVSIPIPYTYYFSSLSNLDNLSITYPIIAKGKFGLKFYKIFKKKAFHINNHRDLKAALSSITNKIDLNDIIIQEIVPTDFKTKTISFTAFCIEGKLKTYWIGEKIREHPIKFGTATAARSINNDSLLLYSKELLKILKYTGVCEIEFLFDNRNNEYKLIEMNPRSWLWVDLAKKCNIDYAFYLYQFLTNKEIYFPSQYKKNIYWINIYTDIYINFKLLFNGSFIFREFIEQFRAEKVIAIWDKNDLIPFFIYFLLIPSLLKNR